jgi:hypothetical protein
MVKGSSGSGSPSTRRSRAGLLRVECDGSRRAFDVDIFRAGKDAAGQPDVVPFNDGQFVYQVEATQNYPASTSSAPAFFSRGRNITCGWRRITRLISCTRINIRAAE